MMKHREALAALLRTDDTHRHAAAEHVARCSDCYGLVGMLAPDIGAAPRPTRDAECEGIRGVMHEFVELDPAGMRARHPGAVRHLGWCLACRERMAEVLEIESAFADGTLTIRVLPPMTSPWRHRATDVREMMGRILVRVRDRVAAFVEFPDMVVAGVPAMVPEPSRGQSPDEGDRAGARIIRLDLEEDATVELAVVAVGPERVELELRTSDEPLSGVWLVQVRNLVDEQALVAAQTVRPGTPMVLKGVPVGRYRLEITAPDRRSWWVPLDVTAAAS